MEKRVEEAVEIMTAEEVETLFKLEMKDISSVYEGQANHCCCGCMGMHYAATGCERDMGPSVPTDDEKVLEVLLKVKANLDKAEWDDPFIVSATVEDKLYIVYLKENG